MTNVHQVVKVTRAEFEAKFGLKRDGNVTGVLFYLNDCEQPLIEYEFCDEAEEVEILNELVGRPKTGD